jgi:hypothetical protein
MKKILFIIPLLGICASLLAQAPTVKNVQAEQIAGTKDVNIQAEFTGKLVGEYGAFVLGEVWFKKDEADINWVQVQSLYGELAPGGGIQPLNMSEYDPGTGETNVYPTIDLGEISDATVSRTLTWKAGDDAPNINTSSAKIRIIAFYLKMEDDGVTPKPFSEQISGWNGEGDFGGSGGSSSDGNSSSESVDSDGDGFSDDEETAAGSDPYNSFSTPANPGGV